MVTQQVRRRLEERERDLSPFAARVGTSRGRRIPEGLPGLRSEFQLDRDRILHTNAFRRLKHKTQVFIAPLGDHYVTRLTHTLEVAQIGRTIARALNLNEDLVEAVALGHDLGHTPFGHIGEEVLNQLYPGGFKHAAQSLRVVDLLEGGRQGLNLTWEVRQGIVAHSKPRGDFLKRQGLAELTLEAQICRLADVVAYVNHDIRDAVRAGVLKEEELPTEALRLLGRDLHERLDILAEDIVESSWAASGEVEAPRGKGPTITMSPRIRHALTLLREFLFDRVYSPVGRGPEGQRAREIVQLLYHHFCALSEALPPEYSGSGVVERNVVDYIAGMTDYFALRTAEQIRPGISEGVQFMGL